MMNAKIGIKINMKTACDLWNEGYTFPLYAHAASFLFILNVFWSNFMEIDNTTTWKHFIWIMDSIWQNLN